MKKKNDKSNKENEEEEDPGDEEENQNPSKSTGTQKFLTPTELREHMRGLWTNDKTLLKHLFKALSLNVADQSTDIFFLDVIPVPPSRFRPVSISYKQVFTLPILLIRPYIIEIIIDKSQK